MRLITILALLLATTPALAADPAYVGTWGVSAAQCKTPQDRQGAPMIVTAKGYDQHEAHCSFRSVKASRSGWRIAAACSVEGDKQKHSFTLQVAGDVLTMTENGRASSYKRCK